MSFQQTLDIPRHVITSLGCRLPTAVNFRALLANQTEVNFTVPDGEAPLFQWVGFFFYQPGTAVWVVINGSATIPDLVPSLTDNMLNPPVLELNQGDTVSFLTNDAASAFGVSLYPLRTS